MKKLLLTLVLVASVAAVACATPISYISMTTVPTRLYHEVSDQGTLTYFALQSKNVMPFIVHYSDRTQEVHEGAIVCVTMMEYDDSVGGRASGRFGGMLMMVEGPDENSLQPLMIASVDNLALTEVFDNAGIFAATGSFTWMGGVPNDFALGGLIYQITFQTDPAVIDDLSKDFVGVSNITITPVPEPLSIGLLSLGLAGLAVYRRRR